jgi:hypothetical protein
MTNINLRSLLKVTGLIMMIIGGAFVSCIPVALIYSESIMPFLWPALICLPAGPVALYIYPGLNQGEGQPQGRLPERYGIMAAARDAGHHALSLQRIGVMVSSMPTLKPCQVSPQPVQR